MRRLIPGLLVFFSGLLAGCVGATTRPDGTPCPKPWNVEFDQEKDFKDHHEIEVRFQSGCEELAGTLFMPSGREPLATVVFVHGAGRSSRLHYTGEFLAPLVESGVVVFSYDKRGVGASEGECCPGDRAEFDLPAADVLAAISAIRKNADIQAAPIGLIGVSQAGWIIPMAATDSPDVSFAVLLSGPAVSVGSSNYFDGLTDDGIPIEQALSRLSEAREEAFDPQPFLEELQIPALWLYGELDEDQPTAASVDVLEELVEGQGKDFMIVVFPNIGHDLTHEPKLVPTIVDWIGRMTDSR